MHNHLSVRLPYIYSHLSAMCGCWQQQQLPSFTVIHMLLISIWPVLYLLLSLHNTLHGNIWTLNKNTQAYDHSTSIIKNKFGDMVIMIRNLRETLHGEMACHNCSDHKCMLYCLYKVFMLHGWCAQNVSRQQHWCTAWLIRVIKSKKGQMEDNSQ